MRGLLLLSSLARSTFKSQLSSGFADSLPTVPRVLSNTRVSALNSAATPVTRTAGVSVVPSSATLQPFQSMETPQRTVQSASRQKASLKEEGLRAQYPWLLHLRGCRSQPPETFKFDTAKFEAKLEQILSEPSEVSETSSDEEVLKILQRMETGLSSALSNLKSAPHASSSLRDGLQSSLKQLECGITCTQAMMHKDEEAIAAAFEHPLMQACKPNSLNGSSIEEEDSQDKAGRDGAVRDTAEEQGDFDVTAFDSALLETDPETDEVVFESGCESSSCSDDEESSDEDSPKVPFIWWRENDLEDALKDLVGLEDLKQMLRQWCKGYALDKKRRFTGKIS